MPVCKIVYYIIMLLALSAVIIRWTKLDKNVHIFFWIILCAFLSEALFEISLYFPIYRIYTILEYFLISVFYYKIIKYKLFRKTVIFAAFLFSISIIYLYTKKGFFFNSVSRLDIFIEAFLLAILSMVCLLDFADLPSSNGYEKKFYLSNPYFWLTLSNLLFFSTHSIFDASTFLPFEQKAREYEILLSIDHAANYVLYSGYLIAFLCNINIQTKRLE